MTDPLIRTGVSMAEYRSWPGYSSSDLKAFRYGPPAMVPWRRTHPEESSDAMKLGTAAHCAIIEPQAFEERFVHKPDGLSFATKEGKTFKANIPDGKVILTHDEWLQVEAIVGAFKQKAIAAQSLEEASACEASLTWTDEATGLPLKARPDWFTMGGYVVDLKISRHAGSSLAFQAWREGWLHQLAYYVTGLRACDVDIKGGRLVVIGPAEPQALRVYCVEVKSDAIGLLALENERTLKEMAECHEKNEWPGTPDCWDLIDLPPVAISSLPIWPDDEGNDLHPLTGGGR